MNVIATHAVGNMDTWLAGGPERAELFKNFCSGYRVYRHPDAEKVSLVWENVDMDKLKAAMQRPETDEAKARHTVLEPIEMFVEAEGAR